MRAVRVRRVVPLVVAMSLLAFACASPPEAEKKAADAAVSAAQSAGAEKYAPSEFSAMTAAVKKAESEMSNKAYKEAKVSYQSAKDLADMQTVDSFKITSLFTRTQPCDTLVPIVLGSLVPWTAI